jgi:hypothetical protein
MYVRKNPEEIRWNRIARKMTLDSEFYGVLGTGYPNSFYRIYVKCGKSQWYVFERHFAKSYYKDPSEGNKDKEASKEIVRGRLADLLSYEYLDWKESIGRVFDHVRTLSGLKCVSIETQCEFCATPTRSSTMAG